MQIQQYLRVLRAGWWIILAMLLVSTGIGLAYSYFQTPIYETTATFVVNPSVRIAQTYDLLYSIDTLAGRTSLATTYANVLQSRVIIETAAASLGIPPEILARYEIKAVVLPDSTVLLLQIQGPSPEAAVDLANAIGAAGLEYIGNLQEIYELRRLDSAVAPLKPISPDHFVDVMLSVMVGLAGGLGFIILRQILTQSFGESPISIHSPTPVMSGVIESSETKKLNDVRSKTSLQTDFSATQSD